MDADREELDELAVRSAALRATVERLQTELAAVHREQAVIEVKLQSLGVLDDDELKTSIDRPVSESLLPPPVAKGKEVALVKDLAALKAAGAGAGLTMGVVVIVLLTLNLGVSRPRAGTAASAAAVAASAGPSNAPAASAPAPVASPASSDEVAPPGTGAPTFAIADLPVAPTATAPSVALPAFAPVVVAPASAADAGAHSASAASSAVAGATGTGGMTIVCTPKCDSILDNNAPLPANNVANLPVPAGTHKLVLSAPNGVKKTMLVNVVPGQTKEVKVSMDRDSPRDYGF